MNLIQLPEIDRKLEETAATHTAFGREEEIELWENQGEGSLGDRVLGPLRTSEPIPISRGLTEFVYPIPYDVAGTPHIFGSCLL